MRPVTGKLALPAAALVAALALSSCGTTASPGAAGPQTTRTSAPTSSASHSAVGPPATGPANNADVDFAMSMITSHLQADAIADLAPEHARANKIKALAPKVKKVQGPEVTAMSGWLVGAGIPVPDATGGHDMSGMGGTKMTVAVSPQELAALAKATGAGFDRMWLQLMLKSHRAAMVTARTELAKGINAAARKIAQSVIDRQSGEIATMTLILAGLTSP